MIYSDLSFIDSVQDSIPDCGLSSVTCEKSASSLRITIMEIVSLGNS